VVETALSERNVAATAAIVQLSVCAQPTSPQDPASTSLTMNRQIAPAAIENEKVAVLPAEALKPGSAK
jgi:hypothetical protein